MDYLDEVIEKLRDWARKLVESVFGPEPEPEPELIPIPVRNRSR
jgi:hypothetical protein